MRPLTHARRLPSPFAIVPSAMQRFALLVWTMLTFTGWLPAATTSSESSLVPAASIAFVRSNCIDCHDGPSGEGGFDVMSLQADVSREHNFERWVRALDRVEGGEMPPPEDASIDAKKRDQFVATTSSRLQAIQEKHHQSVGRVRARRLTNEQLERTLQDLLHIDTPLSRLMAPELRTDGFVNLADAQPMSHFQLEAHLQVVDAALDVAFDRATLFSKDLQLDLGPQEIARKQKGQRNRHPEMRKDAAVVWSAGLPFYGRIPRTQMKRDGWYRITVIASSVKTPKDKNVWCSVRSGQCVSSAPLMSWIGGFEATPEPKNFTYDAWIPAGHLMEIRPSDVTLKRGRGEGGQIGFGELEPQDVPGLAMHRLKIQQIHPGGTAKEVRQRLFGLMSMKWDKSDQSSSPDLSSMSPAEREKQLRNRLIEFANAAYRRPIAPASVQPIVAMATRLLRDGESFSESLRAGYRTILCSPRFLYFVEPGNEPGDESGHLDSWAIASRISYFLTGSMPDAALRRDAKSGKLNQRWKQIQHVDRLLRTRRGQSFVADFAGQWLDLVDINFTEPDQRLFRDFDIMVQDGMLQETHRFLQKHLDDNLSIASLFDADFTFLNERLARFYGIEGVEGGEVRLVSVDRSSHRGGLLTQGAILKVTAAGNDTSPVLRGIWVSEKLLGVEIPAPPASVPAVEPDVRGATTIRELLAKHQSDSSCAACHKNIDPPGFALEHFDAAGRWRDRYLQKIKGKYRPAAEIDPSGVMPDGTSFESFDQFRRHIASQPERLAANLARKLLVYGTGAHISFADRQYVQDIVDRTRPSQFGVRSILHEVVTSDPFLHK